MWINKPVAVYKIIVPSHVQHLLCSFPFFLVIISPLSDKFAAYKLNGHVPPGISLMPEVNSKLMSIPQLGVYMPK